MTSAADQGALPALPGDDPANRRTLPERVVPYLRIRGLLVAVVVIAVGAFLAWRVPWFGAPVRWTAVAMAGAVLLLWALITPPIRRQIFWYSITPDEIDIQHGLLVRTRTVVPMNRVQHLKSANGPLADRFRLATVHIHTAAGGVEIVGLDRQEADQVRAHIAALAHLADDV